MHASRSLDSRVGAAVDLLRLVIRGCRAMVVANNGAEMKVVAKGHTEFESNKGQVFDHAMSLALQSHNEGHIVVDSSAKGMGYALPVIAENGLWAAIYVASDNATHRLDSADLDSMRAAASVIGLALHSAQNADAEALADPLRELLADSPLDGEGGHSLKLAKHVFEKRLLRNRLAACHGNIAAAARTLKMDRGQLSRLLKKHQVEKSGLRADRPR